MLVCASMRALSISRLLARVARRRSSREAKCYGMCCLLWSIVKRGQSTIPLSPPFATPDRKCIALLRELPAAAPRRNRGCRCREALIQVKSARRARDYQTGVALKGANVDLRQAQCRSNQSRSKRGRLRSCPRLPSRPTRCVSSSLMFAVRTYRTVANASPSSVVR